MSGWVGGLMEDEDEYEYEDADDRNEYEYEYDDEFSSVSDPKY